MPMMNGWGLCHLRRPPRTHNAKQLRVLPTGGNSRSPLCHRSTARWERGHEKLLSMDTFFQHTGVLREHCIASSAERWMISAYVVSQFDLQGMHMMPGGQCQLRSPQSHQCTAGCVGPSTYGNKV
jgi:hypothetical protein